jgi:hypothetical protein
MAIIKNSAEGGTDGTVVSAANSGGNSGTAWSLVDDGTTNDTVKFSTAGTMYGSLGYLVQVGVTTDNAYVQWTGITPLNSVTDTMYARCYCKIVSLTGSITNIITIVNNGVNAGGGVGISSAGKFTAKLYSGATAATSTNSVPIGSWFLLECKVIAAASGTGQVQIKIYLDPYASSPTETVTTGTVATGPGLIGIARFGALGGTYTNLTMYMDEIAVQDTGYIGPVAAYQSPFIGAV